MRDFNHSVGVLVQAYFDGTLEHGNCYACAVGNMVAAGLGVRVVKDHGSFIRNIRWDNGEDYPAGGFNEFNENGWGALFATTDRRQEIDEKFLQSKRVQEQISATGYSWRELARIEFAFESVDRRRKDKMFNGLMAVVDVLADIHGIDLQSKEEAKALFQRH